MIQEVGRFKTDLPENMSHLARQIQRFSARFFEVNPETVEGHNRIAGEATITFGGGDLASLTNSIFT